MTLDAPGLIVLGYGRVSTDEQAFTGAGLAAQQLAVEGECDRRAWTLAEFIEDRGASGKDLRRPGIVGVLDRLSAGEADVLMVAKLDRLSRSMLDFASIMARAQQEGWSVVALDCAVDTTTPAGEAMAHVLATFAQFERRLIGQRTREALAVRRKEGVRLGRPREIPARTRARIRKERSQGAGLREIAERLDAEGVPTARGGRWRTSTVDSVLRSRSREPETA